MFTLEGGWSAVTIMFTHEVQGLGQVWFRREHGSSPGSGPGSDPGSSLGSGPGSGPGSGHSD